MKLLAKVGAAFDQTIGSLAIFAGVLTILMMLSVCTDIVLRYFLNRPITGVLEITEMAIVAVTFLGAAWLLKREGHVRIDVVIDRLSPSSQALLNSITSIVGVITCLTLAWYSANLAVDHFQRGVTTFTVLRIVTFPRFIIIAVGSFLLSMQFIRRSYGYLRSWRSLTETENKRGEPEWNGG